MIVLAIIIASIYVNDHKLALMIENMAERKLGCDIEISDFRLDGLSRLHCGSIKARSTDSLWFEIDSINIKINPWAILGWELQIKFIAIESVYLNMNFYRFFNSDTMAGIAENDSINSKEFVFPLTVKIDYCNLSNLKVDDNLACYHTEGNLGFSGENISIKNIADFRGNFYIKASGYTVKYNSDILGPDLTTLVNTNLKITTTGINSASLQGIMELTETGARFDTLSFTDLPNISGDCQLTFQDNNIIIDKLAISTGKQRNLSISGVINSALDDSVSANIKFDSLAIDLGTYNKTLRMFYPDITLTGKIDIDSILEVIWANNSVSIPNGIISLKDISYENNLAGISGINGKINLAHHNSGNLLNIDLAIEQVRYDTISVNNSRFIAGAAYDKALSLVSTNATILCSDLYGGEADIAIGYADSGLKGNIKISNISLTELAGNQIEGVTGGQISFEGSPYNITGQFAFDILDIVYRMEDDSLNLDSLALRGKFNTSTREPFDFKIADITFSVGQLLHGELTSYTKNGKAMISLQAGMDISTIPEYLTASLAHLLGPIDIDGDLTIYGQASADTSFEFDVGVSVEPTDMLLEEYQSLVVSLGAVIDLFTDPRGLVIYLDGTIGELYVENLSATRFENIKIRGSLIQKSSDLWQIENMQMEFPDQKVSFDLEGELLTGKHYGYDLLTKLEFHSSEAVDLTSDFRGSGDLAAEMFLREKADTLYFKGKIDMRDISLSGKNDLELNKLGGNYQVSGKIFMNDSLFVTSLNAPVLPFSQYRRDRYVPLSQTRSISNLSIARIQYGQLVINDFKADAAFTDGILTVDYFEGNFLDGAFTGSCLLDISKVNLFEDIPDYSPIKYQIKSAFSNIDFDVLVSSVKGRRKKKSGETELDGNLAFTGGGLAMPGKKFSLEGTLNITSIGSKTADRLMKFLDPLEENPGIANTRKLMNRKFLFLDMSYKPRWFSFSIKHGNLYPRLYMDQPFYADFMPLLKVNMPIQYDRIPLNTVLSNISKQGY